MTGDSRRAAVLSVAQVEPPYSCSTSEIIPLVMAWLGGEPKEVQRKAIRLLEAAGVERRFSILEPSEAFSIKSAEKRNRLFIERMVPLAHQCLASALDRANLGASEIDAVISTSCTGFMIPSLDAYLIDRLGMRQGTLRLPVAQMGCAGGVAALGYAHALLRSPEVNAVAVIAAESPAASFRPSDVSADNLVSAAIFGDGVAAAILTKNCAQGVAQTLNIVDHQMYHFRGEQGLMGFNLADDGFEMMLSERVSEVALGALDQVVHPFLESHGLHASDVDDFMVHPGGRRILNAIDDWLSPYGKKLEESREVWRTSGNMSSVTVLHVLEKVLERRTRFNAHARLTKAHEHQKHSLMLGFGPGFSAQVLLFRWA